MISVIVMFGISVIVIANLLCLFSVFVVIIAVDATIFIGSVNDSIRRSIERNMLSFNYNLFIRFFKRIRRAISYAPLLAFNAVMLDKITIKKPRQVITQPNITLAYMAFMRF